MNFIFFAFFAMRTKTSYISWNNEKQNQSYSGELARFIDSYYINQFERIAGMISRWHTSNFQNPDFFQSAFMDLTTAFPIISAITLEDFDGNRIYSKNTNPGKKVPLIPSALFLPPHNKTIKSVSYAIGNACYFKELGELAIPLKYTIPFTNADENRDFLTIFLSLDDLIAAIQKWHFGPKTEFALVNREGKILFHPRLAQGSRIKQYLLLVHERLSSAQNPAFAYSGSKVLTSPNDQGVNVFRTYAHCNQLDWGVFLEQDSEIITRRIFRMRWILLALLTGPLLFTLSAGLLFISQVMRPLEELEDGIKLFEAGLLAEPLPVRSQDEIGRLTQTFNQMVHTLVFRNEEIQKKTRKLTFFNEITSIINQSIDLNTFLDRSLRKILQMMQTFSGWIYVFDPQLKRMSLVSYLGISENTVSRLRDFSFLQGLMKKMYTSGKPSLIRDVARHFKSQTLDATDNIRDLLLVPLRSKKRIVGLLAIASNQKYFLHYKDLDQLTRIGDELGIAVENALLYIELQLKIKEREEVNKDLQEMDRFKNRILSNVSHELRTPITTIKTYIELFSTDKIGVLSADQKEKFQIMSRNVNNLLNLINDLLTLAKIQDQKMLLKNMEVLIFQELVSDVISDTIELAKNKGIKLLWQGPKHPVMVRMHRHKIQQVLQNLVTNAIKFTENGSVKIILKVLAPGTDKELKNEEKRLEVSIVDTGAGIPKKSIKKIFQRFFQVDSSSTRKYVGTGLGLAIVKEILEAHGSEIQVESRINEGSRFWFTIPISPAPKINKL
ncbi:GAF domain-containing protein [bacterium]|nr:GAF domain-containing protein [bacterium]